MGNPHCLVSALSADDALSAILCGREQPAAAGLAHLTATQEAANLLERAEALNWDELTTTGAAKLQLSAQARQTLPEGRVEMLVDGPSGRPLARRVAACVRWRPQPGEPEREVRLVAWRYKNP